MNYNKILQSALMLGGLAFAASASATPSGEMLGNTCAGCHGTYGVSSGPAAPTIAGLSKEYLKESMEEYQKGERPSTIMGRIAKGYTDEEIAAMALFFSQQKFVAKEQFADAAKAAQGAKLHKKYCEKCHEDGGKKDDESSILAGQWMPYMHYTFTDFASNGREMPKKMAKKFDEMRAKHGDEAFDQLVNFYGSQK